MRAARLAQAAAQAEMLRLRRRFRRAGMRAAYVLVAVLFLVAAMALLHVASFAWLAPRTGPVGAALLLAGIDLVVACLLAFLSTRRGIDQIELQALAVRQAATRELAGSALIAMLLGLLRRR